MPPVSKTPPASPAIEAQKPPLNSAGVAELLAAGAALGTPQIKDGLEPYAIVPEGFRREPIPPAVLPALEDHIRAEVRLDDVESFIAYVKAFRTPTTRIFGKRADLAEVSYHSAGGAQFKALLDYHEGGNEQKEKRVAHTATYPVTIALEFATWLATNGKALAQMAFVQFIEANCADVSSPDSATLMEIVLNFDAKINATFQSRVDRVMGGRNLVYQETVEANGGEGVIGQMKVPESLTLFLPVFEGGKRYALKARMEYRPQGGKLAITYHLQRPIDVFRSAFEDLKAEIETALEMEILAGASLR